MPPTVKLATPKPPTPTAVEDGLLPASEARPPWFYAHMPMDYEFVDRKWGFLPCLGEQVAKAGVNGVREVVGPQGRVIGVDDSGLRAGLTRKGATIIDPNDPSLGEWHKYVRAYPCVGGGRAWVFSVERGGVTYTLLANGAAAAHDAAGLLRDFRLWLVQNGKIPIIPEPVYAMLLDREQNALSRIVTKAAANPHLAKQVEAQQQRLADMEATWAAMNAAPEVEPEAPAPAPTGKRRLTAPVAA